MPNTVTLDPVNLSAALNGQRLSHGAAYYKIRHPLVKYSEFMISMKKERLRDKKKKKIKSFTEQLSSMAEIETDLGALGNLLAESESEESDIEELQKKTESYAHRRGFNEELSDDVDNDDIFAPLIKQKQKEHFTLTNTLPALLDEDIPRNTEHRVLRRRGGTLLYAKSEAAELRTRLWVFCLDMGRTKLGPQTQDDEKQTADQLRSNYIRLNLYANRPIKICRWPVEPINVLWRRDEDLQSFYAKASNTKARPLYGFVSCMYTPLLRKVKNVGELVDGGHYLLTSLGDSVEFPLPPLFQEKKEVMTIAENTKQSLTEKILRFLKQDMSQSLMQMANERFAPVQWCRLLTQEAGLDVNEKYFHWLSNSSAFSYLQLVEVLNDRLRQPLPMLTSKELGRKRCNRRPSVALEGDPLALIIDQILDKNGDDNPAIRLAANRDKLEKNKLKQMTLMHDIKQQRFLPAIEDVKRKHQCVAL